MEPTVVVVDSGNPLIPSTSVESITNYRPFEVLDSLDDILVDKANRVELKGLTLNNIETFVVESSLLSTIGIACVAPLILELNDAKSESKENDKIYPSLDYIEQQTTLNSIIISTLINTKSFIVELLINRPKGLSEQKF